MEAFAGDFEEFADDKGREPLLPADDRLWRHPSELGRRGLPINQEVVRWRWLQRPPSRASVWTAGIVGAVLATGVVALGTHLATALTARAPTLAPTSSLAAALPVAGAEVGTILAARIVRVEQSVASVTVIDNGRQAASCLAVVISSNGLLLAPASPVSAASGLLVTLDDGGEYVAHLVGYDPATDLAVLSIHASHLVPVRLGTTKIPGPMAIALTGSGGSPRADFGTFSSSDISPEIGSTSLVDASGTDLRAVTMGSPVIDGNGDVQGIVLEPQPSGAIVSPAWLAMPVANEIVSFGQVRHGYLGVAGLETTPGGVRATKVEPGSAAAEAGIKSGDLITSIDGRSLTSEAALKGQLYVLPPHAPVTVGITREGRHLTYRAVLDDSLAA